MKQKFSTGYLTPKSKNKTASKNSSPANLNGNVGKFGEISDEVFKKLMSCPIKRQLIIDLITSEKSKIDAYKKKIGQDSSRASPLQKRTFESPTALYRRKVLENKRNAFGSSSDSSNSGSRPASRQSVASTVPSPVGFDKILDGVIAFVEVRTGDRDRSEGVKRTLDIMGATVREKFVKDVTHVIFKDGSYTTYQKANLMKCKLVSVLWLEACKSNGIRVPEKDFPAVGTDTYDHNVSNLCSQMQKDYEEIIRDEFNRSIASGNPLPSVKSLINRSRTVTSRTVSSPQPEDFEVASFMNSRRHTMENDCISTHSDNFSDTEAVIDGDFEDHSRNRSFSSPLVQSFQERDSVIRNNNDDMDLTDFAAEVRPIITNKKCSPLCDIYNKKTPKIRLNHDKNTLKLNSNKHDSDRPNNSIYDKNTPKINLTSNSKPANECDIYSKSKNLSNEPIHLTSLNEAIAETRKLNRVLNKKNSTNTPIHSNNNTEQISNNDINMSSLQEADKTEEKTTSTTMSSLRISDEVVISKSNEKVDSFSKKSFSPLKPVLISEILNTLSNSDKTNLKTNNTQSRTQRTSSATKKSVGNEEVFTPFKNIEETISDNQMKALSQNVTVRKNNLRSRRDKSSYTKRSGDLIEINKENLLVNQRISSFVANSSSDSLTRKVPRRAISFSSSSSDEDQELEKKNIKKSLECTNNTGQNRNRRKTISVICNETDARPNKIQRRFSSKQTNNMEYALTKNVNTLKENTEATLLNSDTNDYNKPRSSKRTSVMKKEENNTSCIQTRRKTISFIPNDYNKKTNENNRKRYRKLYDPNKTVTEDICVEEERSKNRQKEKTQKDSGVFVIPSLHFSEKARQRVDKNNLNILDILNPNSTQLSLLKKGTENKKKRRNEKEFDSDDDEQVELKNALLNKDKEIETTSGKSPSCNKTEVKQLETPGRSKKNLLNNKPQIIPLRKSLRTPKPSKKFICYLTTPKTIPRTKEINRRSTLEFQSATVNSKRRLKIDKIATPSIVCTKMHKEEVQTFAQIVKKLGKFEVEDEVSSKTTHLVAGEPKRTINMLRAISRGCWILKKEWLFRSLECGKWLTEEDFEETSFSPAVQKNRLQRQAFGPSYKMDLFQDCGLIYIARSSIPRCSDLRELVVLCNGKVTTNAKSASIVVGEYVQYKGVTCVKETWILDCISSNKLLSFKQHIITCVTNSSV